MRFAGNKWQQLGIAGLVALLAAPVLANDIAPFRVTSLDGEINLRNYFDEDLGGTQGTDKTGESRLSFEEEIFLRVNAYAYHPNFLRMDLGGGPLLVQTRVDSGGVSNSSNDALYNLTTHFNFLEQKPYPVSVYYEHLNPSVYVSSTSRFLQENNKVGFNAAFRPEAGANFSFDAFRLNSDGQGPDQIVDEQTEQAAFRIDHTLGTKNTGRLLLQRNNLDSSSGSTSGTIFPTTSTTDTVNYDTNFVMGKNGNIRLHSPLTYVDQIFENSTGVLDRYDLRFLPDLRWYHSAKLDSYYRLNYFDSQENAITTNNRGLWAGLNHRTGEHLSEGAELRVENNSTTGLDVASHGIGGNLKYLRNIKAGEMQLSYRVRYDRRDQTASAATVPVIGELITLPGTVGVPLANDFIVSATIRVSNTDRSQVYVENTDYRVLLIGARTEIQRIASGAILDGEQVLVDYEYLTGGTVDYSMLNQNLQASWNLKQYYNIYAHLNSAVATINAGTPTVPLNTGTSFSTGARADVPLGNDLRVGGEYIFDNFQLNVSPFVRNSIDAYVEKPLPFLGTLRLSARRVLVDNIGSDEDVDLKNFMLRLRARPWFRANLTADLNFEEDTGGSVYRSLISGSSTLTWRVRRLVLNAELRLSRELQGTYERDRKLFRFFLTREIL